MTRKKTTKTKRLGFVPSLTPKMVVLEVKLIVGLSIYVLLVTNMVTTNYKLIVLDVQNDSSHTLLAKLTQTVIVHT